MVFCRVRRSNTANPNVVGEHKQEECMPVLPRYACQGIKHILFAEGFYTVK